MPRGRCVAGADANATRNGPTADGCSPATSGSPRSGLPKMWNTVIDASDPGVEVLHAYTVKENLRQLLQLAGANPDRSVISHRLWCFYAQAAASDSPEVHRLAATVEAW